MAPSVHANAKELIRYVQSGLVRAVADSRHPWRLPVLVTAGAGRVLVLRGVDPSIGTWRFFTDSRTPKVKTLTAGDGDVGATFYHPKERTQLRLRGKAELVSEAVHKELWSTLAAGQKSSYGALLSPGSELETAGDGLSASWSNGTPTAEEEREAFENFSVYDVQTAEMELLLLHREGHRRCSWRGWAGDGFRWLVP